MFIILTGLLAGFLHTISGPDHVAAIAPVAVRKSRSKWRTGALWGLGHTAGVWAVGLGAYLLKESLPLDVISFASERLVGALLIGIGIWSGRSALRNKLHTHRHNHDGEPHTHIHIHAGESHDHSHATGGIGLLHGIAGSSHLFGVLPAMGLATPSDALAYLLAFGVSSILCMSGFTWLLSEAVDRFADRFSVYRWVLGGSSAMAIIVGTIWLTV